MEEHSHLSLPADRRAFIGTYLRQGVVKSLLNDVDLSMRVHLPVPELIQHKELPEEICLGFYREPDSPDDSIPSDAAENLSGSHFIRMLAEGALGIQSLQLVTRKNEKPKAFFGRKEYSVSFSHTRMAISGAISSGYIVGCDLEDSGRKVTESLVRRIRSDRESALLYRENPAIRLWTCKEAALKMTGTGLRKPMSGITLVQENSGLFSAEIDDAFEAEICSFLHKGYWVSVCFRKDASASLLMGEEEQTDD